MKMPVNSVWENAVNRSTFLCNFVLCAALKAFQVIQFYYAVLRACFVNLFGQA